jgi:hypothetical protein
LKTQNTSSGILWILLIVIAFSCSAVGQSSDSKSKGLIFKAPSGYMPADFPEKRAGKMFLHPERPAGMFVTYLKEGESAKGLSESLESMVASMFFHDAKSQVVWSSAPLPPHEGTADESGTIYLASDEKMEVQLVTYSRTVGSWNVLYGYYGMRHKGKKAKDDAGFIDASGKGVEDFDKLWKTIQAPK